MSHPARLRLTIEFDLRADPIAGVVYADGDDSQAFAGWMALTRVIEVTLDAARAGGQPGGKQLATLRPSPRP